MSRKVTRVLIDGNVAARRSKGFIVKTCAIGEGKDTKIDSVHLFNDEGDILVILPIKDREFRFLTDGEWDDMNANKVDSNEKRKIKAAAVIVKAENKFMISGLYCLEIYKGIFESENGSMFYVDGMTTGFGCIDFQIKVDNGFKIGDVVNMYEN
jgi:hypothetical protein